MRAMNDRVIAKVGWFPETVSGIQLAGQTLVDGQAKTNVGVVVSVGPGVLLRTGEKIDVGVKPGEVITWEQFGGLRYDILGENYVCIRSEDIGCVLEADEYKGWLFDEGEIEAFKKNQEEEIEKRRKVLAEGGKEIKKVIYICKNDACRDYDKEQEKNMGQSICESCGVFMPVMQR